MPQQFNAWCNPDGSLKDYDYDQVPQILKEHFGEPLSDQTPRFKKVFEESKLKRQQQDLRPKCPSDAHEKIENQ